MDEALGDWGPDGSGLQIDGHVGLGARLLCITAEDKYEQQPLTADDCLLVTHVRLDNRTDLGRDLGLALRHDLPDSALVMAAYRRYGLDCVEYLQGDWAFALWDRRAGHLLLARCTSGSASLFWCRQAGRFLFATGIAGLVAHPEFTATLNPQHLASLLMAAEDPDDAATVYKDVRLLEPGHLLIVTAGGVERRRWWRPENLAPLMLPTLEQYYEAFRELYATVVGQYLRIGRGGIAATLSGGLDSSSVAALAAARMTQPLKAYVHAPFYESVATTHRICSELPQALMLAEQIGNIEVLPVYSPDISVMTGIKDGLRANAAPGHAASNEYWFLDILRSARAAGVRVLLIAHGGNATVSYSGTGSLLRQLFAGRVWSVMGALREDRSGLWAAAKWRLLKPLAEPALTFLSQWRPNGLSILNPALKRDFKVFPVFERPFATPVAFRLGLQGAGRGRARWMAAGATHGIDIRDPTRDRRLVEFCWRLPDEVFWANGQRRGLIRQGMAEYLPAAIREEPRKGLQSSDLQARVRAEAAEIRLTLQHISGSSVARDYLDLTVLRRTFEEIAAGGNSMPQFARAFSVIRGLGVGLFLTNK